LISPRYTKIDLSKIAKIAFWALLNRDFRYEAKGGRKMVGEVPYLSQLNKFIQLLLLKQTELIL